MDTPVEPLVDFVDTLASGEATQDVVVTKDTDSPAMNEELQAEAEGPGELPNTLRGSSERAIDPRLDTQRHLSVPHNDPSVCELPALDVNQPVDKATEGHYYDDPTPREKRVVVADKAASPDENLDVSTRPEPLVSARTRQDATDRFLAQVHEFLYAKIIDTQCSSHAKEIHEFIGAHLSPVQQAQLLPSVFTRLSQRFQDEATKASQEEVSVDIQSSLCLLEQMFLSLGRLSPLQDMYTAEEEEMLDELAHGNSSNTVVQL